MKSFIAAGIAAVSFVAAAGVAQAGGELRFATPSPGVAPVTAPAVSAPAALRTFPRRLSGAHLRRADRLSYRIKAETGGVAATQVRLCVAPTGAVTDAQVVGSSGIGAFDKIVLDAAHTWSYQSYTAPTGTRVCNIVSVVYRAP
jgi:TonB family protein